jgi:hypothetical protein
VLLKLGKKKDLLFNLYSPKMATNCNFGHEIQQNLIIRRNRSESKALKTSSKVLSGVQMKSWR